MGGRYKKASERTPEQTQALYAQQRAWRLANPDKVKATWRKHYEKTKEKRAVRAKAYRESHPELFKERRKKIYWSNREHIIAKREAWGKENEEHCKQYRKRREAECRDKIRESKRRWNDVNREHINAVQRAYRAKNRERIQQQFREWCKNHEEHFSELKYGKAPRRAALLQKWQLCGEICYICGSHLERKGMEMDHVLARANGGTNDVENLMPTHSKCNRRKNKRLDYPIARPDLVEKASVIKTAPRIVRRKVQVPSGAVMGRIF